MWIISIFIQSVHDHFGLFVEMFFKLPLRVDVLVDGSDGSRELASVADESFFVDVLKVGAVQQNVLYSLLLCPSPPVTPA